MKVLVLGAYGLIGQVVVRELIARGDDVNGLARVPAQGAKLLPEVHWVSGDLNDLVRPQDWSDLLQGIDAIVNASGALQSGLRDDLGPVQRDAIVALISACETGSVSRFIQISAPGAEPAASTEFLATKGEADAALRASSLQWVILKPGLVISPTAYGGTSLLRTLAAFPYLQPIAMAQARLQTVGVDVVAQAVARVLDDPNLARADFDLVAEKVETLEGTVLAFREWLSFSPPALVWRVPEWLAMAVGRCADLAGLLGWRAPLRTTALRVLADDVVADAEPWRRATGQSFPSLADTLREMPATRQERIFARVQLIFPVLVLLFSAFWISSGAIGLLENERAASLILDKVGGGPAYLSVFAGGVLDIAVGLGLLVRRTFVPACIGAIILSLIYLVLASVLTPELWADPLGPLVKIFPVIGCALALIATAEER